MSAQERPPQSENPADLSPLPSYEKSQGREREGLNKIGTTLGDIVRDIGTANKMAKDKFDGNSALMHTAQGFVTGLVGAGLEFGTEQMWDRAWSNTGPIFDRFLYIGGTTGKLQKLAQNGRPRLYYFIKEGTQDVAMGLLYNFMAFKGQPIFKKLEFKHVLTALTADAAEAFARPGVKEDVTESLKDQTKMFDLSKDIRIAKENLANLEHTYDKPKDFAKKAAEYQKSIRDLENQQQQWEPSIAPLTGWKLWLRNGFSISNPVTHLSVDMMASGLNALWENFWEVRKVRGERGGLEGKKVFMPKKGDTRYLGDRRQWDDHRKNQDRRPYDKSEYRKDKVYYGKGKYDDQKRLEEYELKGN